MDIKEMEENGIIDYYLDLKKYIKNFIDKNYPLSKEDIKSIVADAPSDNVIKRQETYRILNDAMEENLKNIANRNTQLINDANEGYYTAYSTQDFEQDIFKIQQDMLEKLWKAQHLEDHIQTGEQLVDEIVEQSKEVEIRLDEINEVNREINQAEKNFIQERQDSQQDTGMNIGE